MGLGVQAHCNPRQVQGAGFHILCGDSTSHLPSLFGGGATLSRPRFCRVQQGGGPTVAQSGLR